MNTPDEWKPGNVFMESIEVGATTLTGHRCWNSDRFMQARHAEATAKGSPRSVRFLSEDDYRKRGGHDIFDDALGIEFSGGSVPDLGPMCGRCYDEGVELLPAETAEHELALEQRKVADYTKAAATEHRAVTDSGAKNTADTYREPSSATTIIAP